MKFDRKDEFDSKFKEQVRAIMLTLHDAGFKACIVVQTASGTDHDAYINGSSNPREDMEYCHDIMCDLLNDEAGMKEITPVPRHRSGLN